jgi:hypothetical protein
MQTAKKISATEFRIHNQLFYVNYTPSNYFNSYHFEIIFQRLLNWFFKFYGLYLYIQKLRVINNYLLVQLYYYRCYPAPKIHRRGLRVLWTTNKWQIDIFRILEIIQYKIKSKRKYKKSIKKRYVPLHTINLYFGQFFEYFILYFFNYPTIVLCKNLYSFFINNPLLKIDHKILLHKTKYLQRYKWSFDILFFIHYIIVFANTNFFMPFLVLHTLVLDEDHRLIFLKIYNVLYVLYRLKRFMRGIRLAVFGTYVRKDRHGRSLVLRHDIGKIGFSHYASYLLFDIIHCPTMAAIVSIRLWLHYGNKISYTKHTRLR